ncbi:Calmodulin-lysine N-methyltransferase [Hondaea fermentalgiana]|uniref:Calmodulin-lysine N-methyltransferase n=1 Tax=Hondaea fermentalgiana TaxID=2315210 RepID=A0A2R5H1M4_9STRA|nr:Calmodulin-lysine N-methyltransferase [Hondaea fermentalgiana]|eukprot:GBG34983.1 Calmodulin-lysine N-methyltransferase [Hondaea fermentalgiana]
MKANLDSSIRNCITMDDVHAVPAPAAPPSTSLASTTSDSDELAATGSVRAPKMEKASPSSGATEAPTLTRDEKWARLRRAVFSASRAKLFVDVPELEVGLFAKSRQVVPEGTKLTFAGWETLAEASIPGAPDFAAVDIVRPRFEEADDAGAQAKEDQVDTTGLLKLYPSEEVLGAYLLLNAGDFANQRVLELGAGFCGLAGLLLARKIPKGATICLSDGSQACLDLADRHISLNKLENVVSTKRILWDRKADYVGHETYDTIIIADCLYLNKLHADLLNAIFHLLKGHESRCIIVSPPRYRSLELFVARAAARFHVRQSTQDISFLDAVRTETTRNFKPIFIELRKRTEACASKVE